MPLITVFADKNKHVISYSPEIKNTLADILTNNGFKINMVCGGAGFCGKCIVNVNGQPQKACSYIPCDDITVNIPDSSISHTQGIRITSIESSIKCSRTGDISDTISIAVDIGSTSISSAIIGVDGTNFKIIDSTTIFNPTIHYGSDVISRAQASVNGKKEEMSSILKDTLESEIKRLAGLNHISVSSIKSIYISCNTTMQHILLGLDCTGILSYPFSHAQFEHTVIYKGINVCIIPSFSTFTGGDIVSGLYYLSRPQKSRYILLDLGTNAEIVLADGDKLYCTSAAAGPAFEGAGISCGCAYIKGAVKNVSIKRRHNSNSFSISYKTIDNKMPVGICGSGILDIYSQFILNNIIDSHKTFNGQYIDSGFEITKSLNGPLTITQKDIRHVQVAVSAIKTGIDILMLRSGLTPPDIEKIYLAGSFGASLDPETLKNINILPEDFFNRKIVEFPGNTSLYGAVKASVNKCSYESLNEIICSCSEIELANEPEFNSLFIGNM